MDIKKCWVKAQWKKERSRVKNLNSSQFCTQSKDWWEKGWKILFDKWTLIVNLRTDVLKYREAKFCKIDVSRQCMQMGCAISSLLLNIVACLTSQLGKFLFVDGGWIPTFFFWQNCYWLWAFLSVPSIPNEIDTQHLEWLTKLRFKIFLLQKMSSQWCIAPSQSKV